ncbi:MAG: hypothetical protein AAFO93_11550 [Pseudomonadota bacterium]
MLKYITIFLVLAGQAQALSCMQPSIAGSYAQAAQAEESYVIWLGTFTFDQATLPKRAVENTNPPDTLIPARFTGHAFNGRAFEAPIDRALTINAQCFGPWCSFMESGTFGMAFVELTDAGPVLSLSPCGGAFFQEPTTVQIEQVAICHEGGFCSPSTDG